MDEPFAMIVSIVFLSLLFGFLNRLVKARTLARPMASTDAQATAALVEIEKLKQRERAEARACYERVALAKLEVMKTALAMGFDQAGLEELDRRLEGLVGTEKMKSLMDNVPQAPQLSSDLMDADLEREIFRLRESRQGSRARQAGA